MEDECEILRVYGTLKLYTHWDFAATLRLSSIYLIHFLEDDRRIRNVSPVMPTGEEKSSFLRKSTSPT